jgi:hypothetical protein
MIKKGRKLDPAIIASLNDVHLLYERVSKMAVWPFDINIFVKFSFTASYPILGSIIVAFATKSLGLV